LPFNAPPNCGLKFKKAQMIMNKARSIVRKVIITSNVGIGNERMPNDEGLLTIKYCSISLPYY